MEQALKHQPKNLNRYQNSCQLPDRKWRSNSNPSWVFFGKMKRFFLISPSGTSGILTAEGRYLISTKCLMGSRSGPRTVFCYSKNNTSMNYTYFLFYLNNGILISSLVNPIRYIKQLRSIDIISRAFYFGVIELLQWRMV